MPQAIRLSGQPYVLLTRVEYDRLVRQAQEAPEPALPDVDVQGNCPAVAFADAVIARKIIRGRRTLGLTQVELARRAGIRHETLNRLEQGKQMPTLATIDKIARALKEAGETEEPAVEGPFPHGRWLYDPPQAPDERDNGQQVQAVPKAIPPKARRRSKK